jgi:hypothetical protein
MAIAIAAEGGGLFDVPSLDCPGAAVDGELGGAGVSVGWAAAVVGPDGAVDAVDSLDVGVVCGAVDSAIGFSWRTGGEFSGVGGL